MGAITTNDPSKPGWISQGGSTTSCASTINYRVASHDEFWIYYPVCRFDPKRARIKIDKERRTVSIVPTKKVSVDIGKSESDIYNGGYIHLHVRAVWIGDTSGTPTPA